MELKIKNLSKTYSNGIKALNNVEIEIETGMFGLLGPNGAGKSTLMRTLATLQDADIGSIEMLGIDFLKEKQKVKTVLGYLPQEFGFYPKATVEEMLSHFVRIKGISNKKDGKDEVNYLLQQTNLFEKRKVKTSEISGGMKQRLAIAIALIGNPKLIIVDEPTAGLDPAERRRFLNLLSEIGKDKIVILSTHIVDDINQLCGDMAILNNGRIVEKGKPADLILAYQNQIWEKTIPAEELEKYKLEMNVISVRLFMGETIIRVLNETCPDDSFKSVAPNLEDVYFDAIQSSN